MNSKVEWLIIIVVFVFMSLMFCVESCAQTLERKQKGDTIYVQELSVYMDYETFISYAIAKAQVDSSAVNFSQFEAYTDSLLKSCNNENQRLKFRHSVEMQELENNYAERLKIENKKAKRRGFWRGVWQGAVALVVVEIVLFFSVKN